MPLESDPQLPPDPDYSGQGGPSGYGGGASGGFFPAQPGEVLGGFGRIRKRGSLGGLQSYMNLPDPEEGRRVGRNRPRPGGGPGAGGPGGRGGFGGFNPNLFRGENVGAGEGYLPIMLRKRGLQMPGVTPGAPGKSDTVPAMLTPGEVVMNRGVTQNPEMMKMLLSLNQQGAQQNPVSMSPGPQGFAEGGLVMEDDADGMESGVSPDSPALKFIRLLLALDGGEVEGFSGGGIAGLTKKWSTHKNFFEDYGKYMAFNALVAAATTGGPQGMEAAAANSLVGGGGGGGDDAKAEQAPYDAANLPEYYNPMEFDREKPVNGFGAYAGRGGVEGFARGGIAGLGRLGGGFGRMGGGFGRMGGGLGKFRESLVNRIPAQQQGGQAGPGPSGTGMGYLPGGQTSAPGGWNYDTEGNATQFDPSNPWGGFKNNRNAFGLGLLYRGIGNAGAQGAFDPRGNQTLVNQQIEAAQGTKDALVRRQMSAADVGGLDPAQRAVARLQALRETGRGVQDIAANVRAGAADRAQSFNEDLYRTAVGGGLQYSLNNQGERIQQVVDRNRAKSGKDAGGGFAGQSAGAALGGWAGGGFANPFGGRRP